MLENVLVVIATAVSGIAVWPQVVMTVRHRSSQSKVPRIGALGHVLTACLWTVWALRSHQPLAVGAFSLAALGELIVVAVSFGIALVLAPITLGAFALFLPLPVVELVAMSAAVAMLVPYLLHVGVDADGVSMASWTVALVEELLWATWALRIGAPLLAVVEFVGAVGALAVLGRASGARLMWPRMRAVPTSQMIVAPAAVRGGFTRAGLVVHRHVGRAVLLMLDASPQFTGYAQCPD